MKKKNLVSKEIVVIISVLFISLLCELFPAVFHYEYFILYYLIRMGVDKIWGDE